MNHRIVDLVVEEGSVLDEVRSLAERFLWLEIAWFPVAVTFSSETY